MDRPLRDERLALHRANEAIPQATTALGDTLPPPAAVSFADRTLERTPAKPLRAVPLLRKEEQPLLFLLSETS